MTIPAKKLGQETLSQVEDRIDDDRRRDEPDLPERTDCVKRSSRGLSLRARETKRGYTAAASFPVEPSLWRTTSHREPSRAP